MSSYGSLRPYVPWRERALPIDWQEEFGRQAPLKVELGFGNGDFLVRSADSDREANYIGIEMTWGSVWRALRKTRKAEAAHLRLLLEDARIALSWVFEEKSVTSFTGLFPCPWPKKRHAKNRLFSPDFLLLCNSRLVDGGTLTVVTDAPAYRDQMLEELTLAATGMSITLENIPASFGTKYERKWQAGGQEEFYRLTFTKVEHRHLPHPETIVVKHHFLNDFHPEQFAPQDEKEPYTVAFKSFLYDSQKQVAMQEVVTHEDGIDQHFWISVRKTSKGWKISPAPGAALLPLPSVQRALDLALAATSS